MLTTAVKAARKAGSIISRASFDVDKLNVRAKRQNDFVSEVDHAAEEAIISVPPFKVSGFIHLMPERSLREALTELTGHFLPVTDAAYWSDTIGEPREVAALLAVNHERAQILAPHRITDPWAGLEGGARPASPPPEPTGW